uniref:Uncharacterized protein AlNc14C77G5124 n=1 Tax=Albugo laibachii Nc14 TaxID=890382 RepID=F0WES4_9STRA|nr:conserved hypothetical protein [Albugo laibachii Nc14]|eukprot:CCA19706.1 conserved hypothetical protein [Albugo laibachii Nc14]
MVRKKKKGISHGTQTRHDSVRASEPPAVNFKLHVTHVPYHQLLSKFSEPIFDVIEWYEQLNACPSVYAQLNCIQSLRTKCLQLQQKRDVINFETSQCLQALSRLLFRLFSLVHGSVDRLRKSLLTVIHTIFNLFPEKTAIRSVLCDEMQQYIDQIASEISKGPEEDFNKLDLLRAMVETQFLVSAFVLECHYDSLQHLLLYLTTQFKQFCLASTNPEFISSHTNSLALENAELAIKCLILLCSKDTLWNRLDPLKEGDPNFHAGIIIWQQLDTLTRHCCHLSQHKWLPKDVLTQVALSSISLYRKWTELHPLIQPLTLETRADVIFRLTLCSIDLISLQHVFPTKVVCVLCSRRNCQCESVLYLRISSQDDNVYARLATYRALITCSSNEELCEHFGSNAVAPCVLEDLMQRIYTICSTEVFLVRLYGIQVLEIALSRASDIYRSTGRALMGTKTMEDLFALILLNWDHPSKKMYHSMPSLFASLLQLQAESDWMPMTSRVLELRPDRRAKYAMLSILIKQKCIDVLSVWNQSQRFVSDVVGAVALDTTYATASELLVELIKAIRVRSECLKGQLVTAILAAIGSEDYRFRVRLVSYTLPILFQVDQSLLFMLARAFGSTWKHSSAHLWAILHITKHARKRFPREKLRENHLDSLDEIALGLCHVSADIRGTAFDALTASLKSTVMPSEAEFGLIQLFLSQSSHEIAPSDRMDALIGLKNIFIRVRESVRLTEKSVDLDHGTIALAAAFQCWLCCYVIDSIAVGSIPPRTIMGLQVLLLSFEVFGSTTKSLKSLVSTHVVLNLLHLLSSSWDIIRSLSRRCLEIVQFDSTLWLVDTWRAILHWGLELISSARQRECDAGALILCFLFEKGRTSVSITQVIGNEIIYNGPQLDKLDTLLLPVVWLMESLVRDIDSWKNVMEGQTSVRFIHGQLLTMRYVMEQIDIQKAIEAPRLMQNVLRHVYDSIEFSSNIISDSAEDSLNDSLSVVGQATASIASISDSVNKLQVDCRGHFILEENEDDLQERLVVGSWLAIREAGGLLRVLIERFPLPHSADAVWSYEDASFSGRILMQTLLKLKHQGAIASVFVNFEGICRRFLLSNQTNERIAKLPTEWTDFLLRKLWDSTQNFILRRSSGFAYCFLAILRAEPRNREAKIFPRVVEQLLQVASYQATPNCSPRSRVHALNVLKLICQDAVLADDVSAHILPIFKVAIEGFSVSIWAVRNSSMMLYTAITQRAIGDKRVADGARDERIGSSTLFGGCPGFREFLYDRLAGSGDGDVNEARTSGIYFILMVLSRLKPKEDDEMCRGMQDLGDTSLECFVPHVIKCGKLGSAAIRQMAARALAAIVSAECVDGTLCRLALQLGKGKHYSAEEVAEQRVEQKDDLLSNNAVHGLLLQLDHLLSRSTTQLSSFSEAKKQEKTATMLRVFNSVLSYWNESIVCLSIVAQALKVLRNVLMVPHWGDETIREEELYQIRIKCHDELNQLCTNRPRQRPGTYERNRALVQLYFMRHSSPFSLPKTLLQSRYLEIRKTSLRCVHQALDQQPSIDFVNQLLGLLPSLWEYESHPQCRVRILEIGYRCCKVSADEEQSRCLAQEMGQKIYLVMRSTKNVEVRCASLRLLAVWCGLEQTRGVSTASPHLERWTQFGKQLVDWADGTTPLCVRQAVSKALSHSGLLSCWTHLPDATSHCWIAAISFLQADDTTTRKHARGAIQQVLQPHFRALDLSNLSEAHLLSHTLTFFCHEQSTCSKFKPIAERCLEELLFCRLGNLPETISSYGVQFDQSAGSSVFHAENSSGIQESGLFFQHYLQAVSSPSFTIQHTVRERVYGMFTASVEALLLKANVHNSIQHNMLYNKRVFPRLCALVRFVCVCSAKEKNVDTVIGPAAKALYCMLKSNDATAIHPGFLTDLKELCNQ